MAYQALLFCPDEKTARAVTQVLSELEFSVEPCTEPFAAVKKLMAQHFDAIVVDCDNEQNATLLFKSARNSTSNQASLAVAIVEGQAGVAKAFRIGANLVLTKPINVEQSKGTLRVARGLLRKGEPAKTPVPSTPLPAGVSAPSAPAASTPKVATAAPAAGTTVTAAPAAAAPAKAATSKPPALPPRPATSTVVKPAVPAATARSAVATTRTTPAAPSPTQVSKIVKAPVPAAQPPVAPASPGPSMPVSTMPPDIPVQRVVPSPAAKQPETVPSPAKKPAFLGAPEGPVPAFGSGTGTATATAPAREVPPPAPPVPPAPRTPHAAEDLLEKPAEGETSGKTVVHAPTPDSVPAFSFGESIVTPESSGMGKKFLIGAALILIVAGAYLAWDHFQQLMKRANSSTVPAAISSPTQTSAPATAAPAKSSNPISSASQTSSKPTPETPLPVSAIPTSSEDSEADTGTEPAPTAVAPKTTGKSAAPVVQATEPLVVKGGSRPSTPVVAANDAAPPSVVGIAATGSDGALSNIISDNAARPHPVLQSINVSQGVSQGLLVKKVQPTYPKTALALRIEGSVDMTATISKTGAIIGVKVLQGDQQLSRAAVEAVKQWKYKPYTLNGEPVEIQTQITVVFKLPQ